MRRGPFFSFFFFCFSLFKTAKICFGSTKMEIFYREKHFTQGKKSGKMTLPLRKMFLLRPCTAVNPNVTFCKLPKPNAAVNGHLELPLLKDRQRFDAVLTSNLEVLKFRDWWILTYFIFGHGESSLNNFWSMVNLERTCVLLFYYFLCLKANLDLEKTNQLGEYSPNFIFAMVNLDLIILEKRWIDGESWPNNFVEKVNRGEDLRWVGSRWPLTHA